MRDSQIMAELEPLLTGYGLEIETVEIMPAGKRRLLRIVLDGDGPDGRGPSLDEIAEATKVISDALDGSAAVGSAAYTLEVTSRGVGRPLEAPRHWRRNRGRLVQTNLRSGAQLTGRVADSDEDGVELEVDGGTQRVRYADVAKALVQVEFNRAAANEGGDESGEED